jgi:hypothetical protein
VKKSGILAKAGHFSKKLGVLEVGKVLTSMEISSWFKP